MPRPLVFGSGRLLVQLDAQGCPRDLCWPLGRGCHLSGRRIRTGIWVSGRFSWVDSPGWQIHQEYVSAAPLMAREVWREPHLGVSISVLEGLVGPDTFVRELTVLLDQPGEARLFFSHSPHLMESDIGDCACFEPRLGGIVHFKGPAAILFASDPAPGQYACGITGFGELEGTWRDAEDGELSMNPIAQGSVDSTMGVSVAPGQPVRWMLRCAESFFALTPGVPELPAPNSFTRAQLSEAILRSQICETGAILAASDSDIMETNRSNYSYCWMRDAANTASLLLEMGDPGPALRLLEFGAEILGRQPQPYFLQKYCGDGSLGAGWHPWVLAGHPIEPLQEDETASMISLLVQLLRQGVDVSPSLRDAYLQAPLEFLLAYVGEDGLPLPSFDLWEERRGIHSHTVSTVILALRNAGEWLQEDRCLQAAETMTGALLSKLADKGGFRRGLKTDGTADDTIDAATLLVGLLGVLPISHPLVRANAERVRHALWVNTEVGGLARYDQDYYFRRSDRVPGNPWLICTLWLAQDSALCGDEASARQLLEWAERVAPGGAMPEQVHPLTGEHLSVSPLTWSHAEHLRTLRLLGSA